EGEKPSPEGAPMRWFHDLKMFAKLMLAFVVILSITALIGAFSLSKMADVRVATNDIAENWMPSIQYLGDMNTNTSDFRIAELQHILSTTPEQMAEYERAIDRQLENLRRNEVAYLPLCTEKEQRPYAEFKAHWSDYLAEHRKVIELSRQGKKDEAR